MLIYKDVRGPESDEPDGIITDDDKVVIIENKVAPITYGFTIGGKWKGFMLDIFFQGMAGHKKLMDFRGNGINAHTSTFKYYNDHWTPENTNASMPGATQYKIMKLLPSGYVMLLSYVAKIYPYLMTCRRHSFSG